MDPEAVRSVFLTGTVFEHRQFPLEEMFYILKEMEEGKGKERSIKKEGEGELGR